MSASSGSPGHTGDVCDVSLREYDNAQKRTTIRTAEGVVEYWDAETPTIAVPPDLAVVEGKWNQHVAIMVKGEAIGYHQAPAQALQDLIELDEHGRYCAVHSETEIARLTDGSARRPKCKGRLRPQPRHRECAHAAEALESNDDSAFSGFMGCGDFFGGWEEETGSVQFWGATTRTTKKKSQRKTRRTEDTRQPSKS